MLSLIYPAFLGNFLFAYLLKHNDLEPIQRAIATLLLVYFVIGFADTLSEQEDKYNLCVFSVDVGEVALMAMLFTALGVLPPSPGFGRDVFWLLLAWLFLAPMCWRLAAGYTQWMYDSLCLVAIVVCVATRFQILERISISGFTTRLWEGPETKMFWSASDDPGASVLWVLVVVYVGMLMVDLGLKWSGVWDKNGIWSPSTTEWGRKWYVNSRTLWAKWRVGGALVVCVVSTLVYITE